MRRWRDKVVECTQPGETCDGLLVFTRVGVSDEQVMAAVEAFGAKNDPSFKDILQRIATTLQTSLEG